MMMVVVMMVMFGEHHSSFLPEKIEISNTLQIHTASVT